MNEALRRRTRTSCDIKDDNELAKFQKLFSRFAKKYEKFLGAKKK
jgi:hypothetical protein